MLLWIDTIGESGRSSVIGFIWQKIKYVSGYLRSSSQATASLSVPIRSSMQVTNKISTRGFFPLVSRHASSGSITIQGPCGTLEVKEGVIIAHNHIHVTEADSVKMNLKDKERVAVEVFSDRPVIFNDVIIRVSKNFSCRMHIDFDEANAASVSGFTLGRIIRKIETEGVGRSK